jgi:hypothetical protein
MDFIILDERFRRLTRPVHGAPPFLLSGWGGETRVTLCLPKRDRWFESHSLQRRVHCEPNFLGDFREPQAFPNALTEFEPQRVPCSGSSGAARHFLRAGWL